MNNTNSKLRVCYASSNSYIQYSGISMLSLLVNSRKDIDQIYFLSFGANQKNINLLKKIADEYDMKLEVIDAEKKIKSVFDEMTLDLFEGSYATYARAFISRIIDDYHGLLLFIDSDTIVDRSISEIIKDAGPELESKAFAAVISANQYFVGNDEKYLLNGNKVYFQCGVILYNMHKWIEERCTESAIAFIKAHGSYYRYADQTVINNSISEKLIGTLPPKYNYWAHGFRGKRIVYEMSRGKWWSKEEISEAINSPIIIHYKGSILHPWLTENETSLEHIFNKYCNLSPWKDMEKHSIYYDDKKERETDELKKSMESARRYLSMPGWKMRLYETLAYIKRKLLGRIV